MKKFIVGMLLTVLMAGCSSSLININGEVDATEAALIKVTLGAILTESPSYVAPAYTISKALITYADGESVAISSFDTKVAELIVDSGLTASEQASANELYSLLQVGVTSKFTDLGIEDTTSQLMVIDAIIEAVYEAAEARI